jgi:hypothetical protein
VPSRPGGLPCGANGGQITAAHRSAATITAAAETAMITAATGPATMVIPATFSE